jgi:hypothetical protein
MPRFAAVPGLALAGILILAPAGHADESAPTVVSVRDMERALAQAESRADGNRAAVERLLERPEVRDLARAAGLDSGRATAALAVLDDSEAAHLADLAVAADAALAGGQGSQGRMSGGTGKHFPVIYAVLIVAILVALIIALVA